MANPSRQLYRIETGGGGYACSYTISTMQDNRRGTTTKHTQCVSAAEWLISLPKRLASLSPDGASTEMLQAALVIGRAFPQKEEGEDMCACACFRKSPSSHAAKGRHWVHPCWNGRSPDPWVPCPATTACCSSARTV